MRTLTEVEACKRASAITVLSYDIELDLTHGDVWFGSTSTVRFTAAEGCRTFLELDCVEVVEAAIDGRAIALEGSRFALEGLGGEHVVTVVARCAYSRTGEGLHRFVDPLDGAVYTYAMAFLDDAQRIFACFDQPDLKAVFRVQIKATDSDRVLSNTRGTLVDGVHVFEPTQPMSTYLVTLATGAWYGVQRWHDGIELGVWCRASLAPHLDHEELFEITGQCFELQQRVFGSRYPWGDTYDQVFVPEFNAGAMENPGMVTFSEEQFVYRSRATEGQRSHRAKVIAHEMAHMWFGDLATLRWWDGIWLSEAFAELMGFHTLEAATRFTGAWSQFCLGAKPRGYRADQLPTTHPVAGTATDTRAALLNFDGISYVKGAAVLRQLMAAVGEDTFFVALRTYLARHAFGNTDLLDLLVELESASGRDLHGWAESWLRTTGVNTLRPRWDGDALVVVQEGSPLRDHTIEVGAYDVASGRLQLRQQVRIELTGRETPVPDVLPAPLLVINDGDLTFAKTRFDARSRRTLLSSLGTVADPLTRALCWSGLWDAVRDGELPARDYVPAVLAGVPVETDPALAEVLLGQALEAATSYAPPAEQDGLVELVVQDCWSAPTTAGSDLQLVRVRTAVHATRDTALLRGLLTGASRPDGLEVDTELRWLVIRRAAALGALGPADVGRELATDPTAAGQLHAGAALAARPDAAAKRSTWDRLVSGDVTNAQARTQGRAFWQRGQDLLLRPYVDDYVAALPRLWAQLSPQLAESLTSSLFPTTLIEQQVHDQVATLLEGGDLADGLRRRLAELLDDLRRALVAQQAG